MRSGLSKRSAHQFVTSVLLVALILRALIPSGFMPGGNGHFGLVICPDGFPAQLLAHHNHHQHPDSGQSAHFEHCPYGGLASAPTPHSTATASIVRIEGDLPLTCESSPVTIRLVYLPQPRGPPRLG